jgi:uncharacterized membrane protein
MRWVLATLMIVLGVLHFVAVDAFAQIVPPALPFPRVLVWISGVFEIALGLALIPERTRRMAGFCLVALYVAVFPANVYMAVADVRIGDLPPVPPWLLWARLPLQVVFIAWALWVSRTRRFTLTSR